MPPTLENIPLETVAEAMHWLNTSYTVYFNWRHEQIGHLLQGRFKSVLVVDQEHWLHLSMYLHLNPLRAAMVDDPGKYLWSSYLDYTRVRSRFKWLKRDEILGAYGPRFSRHYRYRKECLSMIGKKPEFAEQLKAGIILGPREKLAELIKKYRPSGQVKEVAEFSLARRREIDPAQELKRVAEVFGVAPGDLLGRRRNFPARPAAYYHLVEHCGLSVTETARVMKTNRTAVSMGISRFRKSLRKDKTLQKRTQSLSVM